MTPTAALSGRTASTVASLLAPVSPEQFFQGYWERQHLRVPSDSFRQDWLGIFTIADVDRCINDTGLRVPSLRIAKAGQTISQFAYTRDLPGVPQPLTGCIDADAVIALYASGATLIFQSLHRSVPALRTLCNELSIEFSADVRVNAYMTPAGAQGFGAHWDSHDVFVLQTEGCKHWRLYSGGPELPLPGSPGGTTPGNDRGELTAELTLKPGDVLYVPRGHVHEAFGGDEPSLHLTIGIHCKTWLDALHELVDECAEDARFRAGLPPGLATGNINRFPPGIASVTSPAPVSVVHGMAGRTRRHELISIGKGCDTSKRRPGK